MNEYSLWGLLLIPIGILIVFKVSRILNLIEVEKQNE